MRDVNCRFRADGSIVNFITSSAVDVTDMSWNNQDKILFNLFWYLNNDMSVHSNPCRTWKRIQIKTLLIQSSQKLTDIYKMLMWMQFVYFTKGNGFCWNMYITLVGGITMRALVHFKQPLLYKPELVL